MVKPLKHQKEILSELEGKDKALIHSASGSGKTHSVFFEILKVKPKSFLYVVHRNEILWQSVKIFKDICPFANDDNIGIINEQHKESYKQYLFATVQTISKERNLRTINPYIEYLIVDEFHHSAAPTYQKVIKQFKACKVRGLTATPNRMDKQDIMKQVDNISVGNIDIFDGIKRGIMVPFNYIGLWDNIDWSDVYTWNGYRYKQNDLDKKLLVDERDKQVITEYQQRIAPENRLTIGFCATIKHVKRMTEKFNAAGIKAEGIFYKENLGKRAKILEQFRKGEINVIFTRDILNEGVDFPECEALMFLRPTHSEVIFKQQLGRGLRKRRGKKNVLVLDFISNYEKAYQTKAYLKDIVRGPHIPIEPGKYYKPEYLMRVPTYAFESKVIDTMELQERMQRGQVYTENDLIDNFLEVKEKVGRVPKINDMRNRTISRISVHQYLVKFGTWNNFLKKMNERLNATSYYTDQELIDNFLQTKSKIGKIPTQQDLDNKMISKLSASIYKKHYGSYNNFLKYQGEFLNMDHTYYSDPELDENFVSLKKNLGRIPRLEDMNNKKISKISSSKYVKRYGTWNNYLRKNGITPNKIFELPSLEDMKKTYFERKKELGLGINEFISISEWIRNFGYKYTNYAKRHGFNSWNEFTAAIGEKLLKQCLYCGKEFSILSGKKTDRKYCSRVCGKRNTRKKNIDFH